MACLMSCSLQKMQAVPYLQRKVSIISYMDPSTGHWTQVTVHVFQARRICQYLLSKLLINITACLHIWEVFPILNRSSTLMCITS